MSSLKDRAIKGVLWSAIERFGNQGILFLIGLILARMLMPEDYGLIGMLMVFIAIAQVFVEGGFSASLIRKTAPTEEDYSTVFWFNLVVAVVFYVVIFIFSPVIARFYNEPLLNLLAKFIGLSIVINAFGIIQKTILTKRLDFKSQAKINIFSIVLSGVIGIITAWLGYGVWALVMQNLSRNVLMNVGFWLRIKWMPKLVFSEASFKDLFGFGSKLLLSSLINAISENLYAIIIGKLYNAKSLGYYTRANQFQKLPVSSIYGAIGVVTYPVLSELKHDRMRLKEAYRTMIRMIAYVLFPIVAILACVAEPMVKIILTDKWLPCVPILQILCIVGAFYPLHAINLDILKVKGRSDLFLKLEVIKQVFNILMIVICFRWGVIGLVWGSVAINVLCYYLNSFFSKTLIDYGTKDQLKDLAVFALMSVFIIVIMLLVGQLIHNQLLRLFLIPIAGTGAYLIISYFFKVDELFKIKEIFSNLIKKTKLSHS